MTDNRHTDTIWQALRYAFIAAAYAYLVCLLVQYDDYAALGERLRTAYWQYIYLLVALLLVPLNIFFEAGKWRQLLSHIEPMSYTTAQRQTYFGFVGAFLTPARLGDYPARVTQLKHREHWLSAVALGFIGTLALDFVIIFIGLPAGLFFGQAQGWFGQENTCTWLASAVSITLLFLLILLYPYIARRLERRQWRSEKTKAMLRQLGTFSHRSFLLTVGWSLLRYLTFALQLYLVLSFCGIPLGVKAALTCIPAYYLLITLTPSLTIADPAIRSSWAVLVFSTCTPDTPAIAVAAVIVWTMNTVIPMIVGTFLSKR